jgi:hypothetical protein
MVGGFGVPERTLLGGCLIVSIETGLAFCLIPILLQSCISEWHWVCLATKTVKERPAAPPGGGGVDARGIALVTGIMMENDAHQHLLPIVPAHLRTTLTTPRLPPFSPGPTPSTRHSNNSNPATEYRSPEITTSHLSPAPLAVATARARRVGSLARALSSEENLPSLILPINSRRRRRSTAPLPQHATTQRTDSPTHRKPCPPFRLPPPISSHTTWHRSNPEKARVSPKVCVSGAPRAARSGQGLA